MILVNNSIEDIVEAYFSGFTMSVKEKVAMYLRTINNKRNSLDKYPMNLLVEYENTEMRERFFDAMEKTLEVVFPNEHMGEMKEIVNFDSINKNIVTVFVNIDFNFEDKKHIEFIDSLKQRPGFRKILLVSRENAKQLHDYDEGIYFRTFRADWHVCLESMKEEAILDSLFGLLEKKGFELTEEFKVEIGKYVNIVYPKADLKNDLFVNDLWERIDLKVYGAKVVDKTLTGKDVPYYNKNAVVEPKTNNADEDKVVDREVQDDSFKEYEIDESIEILDESWDCVDAKNEINVLLLAASTCRDRYKLTKYSYIDNYNGEAYVEGVYQLEPIPKMLVKNGKQIDEIIILSSKETEKKVDKDVTFTDEKGENYVIKKDTATPIQFFVTRLMKTGDFNDTRFVKLVIDESRPAEGLQKLTEYLNKRGNNKSKKLNISIDTHGGLRGVQRMIEAVVSLVKRDDSIKAYSIEFIDNTKESKIIDETERLKIFDFVSGINEFSDSGKNDALITYFDKNNKLVKAIGEVSNGIQWNDLVRFDNGLEELKSCFPVGTSIITGGEKDRYLAIFSDVIQKDYEKLLTENPDVIDKIKWCMSKNLFSQALTLAESRIVYDLEKYQVFKINTDIYPLHEDGKWKKYIYDINQQARNSNLITLTSFFNGFVKQTQNNDTRRITVERISTPRGTDKYVSVQDDAVSIMPGKEDKLRAFCGEHEQLKRHRNNMNHFLPVEEDVNIKDVLEKYISAYDNIFKEEESFLVNCPFTPTTTVSHKEKHLADCIYSIFKLYKEKRDIFTGQYENLFNEENVVKFNLLCEKAKDLSLKLPTRKEFRNCSLMTILTSKYSDNFERIDDNYIKIIE